MMDGVKNFATGFFGLTVALLDAARVGQAAPLAVELLAAGAGEPPEWVRFLAPGVNRARDGRSFTVADPAAVARLSNDYRGAIDLLVDYEHQYDRAAQNGKPAPAAGWIKELSATGPDGTPGIWARVEWQADAAAAIRDRKYRYLSAVIEHDAQGVVRRVLRAALTNHPATDTATALFSAQPRKEIDVNATLLALLGALGITGVTTDDDAGKKLLPLAALLAALGKQLGIDISALSALTAEQVATALQKPLADKIATLSATAKVGVDAAPDAIVAGIRALGADPAHYVARSVYDEVSTRLAALTAETKSKSIEEAMKAGKLTPGMKPWAETLDASQLTAFLSTAPVIVNPQGKGNAMPADEITVATLSAEDRAEAEKHGVTLEAWADAKKAQRIEDERVRQLAGVR